MNNAGTITVYKCDITDYPNSLIAITPETDLAAGDSQQITFDTPVTIGGNIQLLLKGTGYCYCGTAKGYGLTRAFYQGDETKLNIKNEDGTRNQIAVTYIGVTV